MLCYLFYLGVAMAAAGAQQTFTSSTEFDISSCSINFYGKQYKHLYVNLTSTNLVVCFTGFSGLGTSEDCIIGSPPDTPNASFKVYERMSVLERIILNNLAAIRSTMDCFIGIYFRQNGGYATLALAKFGTQSALYVYSPAIGTVTVDVQVGGETVETVKVSNTAEKMEARGYADVSGCWFDGVLYKPGTQATYLETCLNLTCDDSAVLETFTCAPKEFCHHNGSCIFGVPYVPPRYTTVTPPIVDSHVDSSTCSVIGPTIISLHGDVKRVPDRCSYLLLSAPPTLQVSATFRERRRTDVSFLDTVMLRLVGPDVLIHLEQGGRVRLNESTLTLNASALTFHGVEISKNQNGLRAKVLLSNLSAVVWFDGTTAQIHLEGTALTSLQGLCGNSSESGEEVRLSEFSTASCETQYVDPADSDINCTKMAERCSLLQEAPFSSCSTDPQPFITACTSTLCTYPDVDGLRCRFLEAFIRTCSDPLEGWRSKAECPPSESTCLNLTCSHHEFCGEKTAGGEARCFCRALFAYKYRETGSLGDPVVCRQNSASVSLPVCLLEDKNLLYSDLHLNDPACRGQVDVDHVMKFSFSSSSCGSEVTTNSSHVIYRNSIRTQNRSSNQNPILVDLSCIYSQDQTSSIWVRNSSVIYSVSSGLWSYSLSMETFSDAGFTQRVEPNSEVSQDQKIWVKLVTHGLNGDMVTVVTDSCWATAEASPSSSFRYDLIRKGCPNPSDPTVRVEGNGRGTSNFFSFNTFEFSKRSSEMFLHCKVVLCIHQDSSCIPDCSPMR